MLCESKTDLEVGAMEQGAYLKIWIKDSKTTANKRTCNENRNGKSIAERVRQATVQKHV